MKNTDQESLKGWSGVFAKAREVADDPSQPDNIRAYWKAILEGRADDAAAIFEEMEQEDKKSRLKVIEGGKK